MKTLREEIEKMHKKALQNRDSGYCNGCAYYEKNILKLIKQVCEDVIVGSLKQYGYDEDKYLIEKMKAKLKEMLNIT